MNINHTEIEAAKKRFHYATRKLFYTHDDYIKHLRRVDDEHYADFHISKKNELESRLYTLIIPEFLDAQREYTNLVAPLVGVHDFEYIEIVNSWHEFMLEAANLIRRSAIQANIIPDICMNDVYEDE